MVVLAVIGGLEWPLEPGSGSLLNDPSEGTVNPPGLMEIALVFDGDEIDGYAANSTHYVDIGGSPPIGIPADGTELYEEGLIIPGVKMVSDCATMRTYWT